MGQTLTHGVYLPNEGERNCYSGLAANWRLLDGAIGTVAAHTTAIAGKADISHNHGNITNDGKVGTTANLPLITGTGGVVQAGSFGTSANTFCEGNDSRLSDARTPVAHTHTKSDVTDLLNSDFIPSANNSYDLGSSRYQWNNLYANNYFYNGTAWGLDKVNVWTNRNILEAWGFTIREKTITDSTPPSSDVSRSLIEVWGNDFRYWGGFGYRWGANGVAELVISNSNWNGNTQGYWEYTIGVNKAFNSLYFNPPNGISDLGTSDHKWKTLNGVNPGALSLPNINYTEGNPDVYNVGTDINNLTKNVSDPLHFSWTAPVDGWLAIMWYLSGIQPPYNVLVTTGDARYSKFSQTWSASSTRWYLASTFPVVKNVTYYFEIDFQNTTIGVVHHAYLLPCLGNV